MPADPQPPETDVESLGKRADRLRRALLAWYDAHGRDLPWRVRGRTGDPYLAWLSEVMLQQTTVAAVIPFYHRFVERFPDIRTLADAPRDHVLEAWAGLGYYSRARNLHAAAVALELFGFPDSEEGWRALPGVGAYTAAALAAITLDQAANVVDGNVERVMARLFAVEAPLPGAKRQLRELAGRFVRAERPGDYAQALMDLGATVCTPSSPKCEACPWARDCQAHARGAANRYPRREAKAKRPERRGAAFLLNKGEAIWLVRRPDKGLLGGMAALPSSAWAEAALCDEDALGQAPARARWEKRGAVRHVFTHFALTLDVWVGETEEAPRGEGWWAARDELQALPSVFRKAAALAARA